MRAAVLTGIVALSLTAAGLLSPHMGPPYARLRQWIEQRLPLRSPAAERTVPGMPPVAPQQNAAADDRPEAGLGCDLGLSPSSTHERCLQLSINRDGARRREKGERIYVRCSAYDRFSGRGWSSSRASRRTVRDIDDGARDGRIRLRRATINEVSCSIIRLGEQGNIVPTIPTVITLQLESAEQDGNDNLFSSLISTNETAAICSMVSSDVRWTDLNPSQRVTGRTAAVYSRLPDDALSRRVRAMVREWAGSEDHPGAIADRILERLRSEYEYASDIKHPTGTNPLEDFLFKARKGDCRFFASGLALALRAASIPSRLASGYCGGEYDPETKLYTFFTDDAHAWVEVYVEGFGWVLIDPTPPVAGAPSAPREARSTIHADTTGTNKAGKQADSRENASGKTETGRWIPGRSLGPWIGGMTMLLAVVIFLVVRSLASWAARRDEERRYGTCRKPNYFRLFCSHYARRGMPIRKGQTAREYLNALKQHGLVGDDCDPLVDYFERTAYGQFPSSPMAESRFKSLVHHLQNRQPPPARG
jgi:transglutaminase-like putative cysteine protease